MHKLHTTDAFVLGSIPHGESNRVYSLFTREFGFLYAHAQGVRQIKNRNRYALTTGNISSITLVRGRETWRITGAQDKEQKFIESHEGTPTKNTGIHLRRIFLLVNSLAPREVPIPSLFTVLFHAHEAFSIHRQSRATTIEALTALRVLHMLGYVASPSNHPRWQSGFIETSEFDEGLLTCAEEQKQSITRLINSALLSAKS